MNNKALRGSFTVTVPEGVTEDQVKNAVTEALDDIKAPETPANVYVGGSDDQPPHP